MRREHVEADDIIFVRRVEKYDIVDTMVGNHAEHPIDEVTVGVETGEAIASRQILLDEVKQKRAFAGAARANQMGMPHANLVCDDNTRLDSDVRICAET